MDTTTRTASPSAGTPTGPQDRRRARCPAVTTAAGGFYLVMGGIHVGIVAADPQIYRPFADDALFGFVRSGWGDIFMAHPAVWGLQLALGEISLGVLLLLGGAPARWGWLGIITFQVLLMLFGWGFWLWSLPALAVLGWGAHHDWPRLQSSPG